MDQAEYERTIQKVRGKIKRRIVANLAKGPLTAAEAAGTRHGPTDELESLRRLGLVREHGMGKTTSRHPAMYWEIVPPDEVEAVRDAYKPRPRKLIGRERLESKLDEVQRIPERKLGDYAMWARYRDSVLKLTDKIQSLGPETAYWACPPPSEMVTYLTALVKLQQVLDDTFEALKIGIQHDEHRETLLKLLAQANSTTFGPERENALAAIERYKKRLKVQDDELEDLSL